MEVNMDRVKSFLVKDLVIIISFFVGLSLIYSNLNDRLVKVETKGEVLSMQVVETNNSSKEGIKGLDQKLKDSEKSSEVTRVALELKIETLTAQVRELEQLLIAKKLK
jgi:hypothetical protein